MNLLTIFVAQDDDEKCKNRFPNQVFALSLISHTFALQAKLRKEQKIMKKYFLLTAAFFPAADRMKVLRNVPFLVNPAR